MNKKEIYQLIDNVNEGVATDEEMSQYTAYLNGLTSGRSEWYTNELGPEELIKKDLFGSIEALIDQHHKPVYLLWPRIAAAAAILLVVFSGIYILSHKPPRPAALADLQLHGIVPGSNRATITLSTGKIIDLTAAQNGAIAHEKSAIITKSADGAISYTHGASADNDTLACNTITTPRGGQWKLTLPDGTLVMLDAVSSIRYPVSFAGHERLVTITGQAYFEVAHNASKPFRVISGGQTVEVLGTHFNINSYPDEPGVKTTLLQGAVKITSQGKTAMLKPGQQATVKGNSIRLSDADMSEAVAWKDGYFEFSDADIRSVMRQVSRWYNVEVQFDGAVSTETLTGRISRSKNIGQVLQMVQKSKSVNLVVKGRRIMVTQ